MHYTVVGLGNPGEEYTHSRHNVGREVVEMLASQLGVEWRVEKTRRALCARTQIEKNTLDLVLPDNYMNRSGASLSHLVGDKSAIENLVVVHDDLDLPLGSLRIVFARGAGGHNGVLSLEKTLKTRAFVRVRVGVVPTTPTGKLRKPKGEDAVHAFILKPLSKKEQELLAPSMVRAMDAVRACVLHGREYAMREYNGVV
jgi:PTH1 family peptidyl-tRNA hydrolase